MRILVTHIYPTALLGEYVTAALKNWQENPFPSFVKMIGPFFTVGEEGHKCYTILEIDKGKEDEAFQIINKRIINFYPIQGFRHREERLATMEEGAALLNIEAPSR